MKVLGMFSNRGKRTNLARVFSRWKGYAAKCHQDAIEVDVIR